MEGLLGMSADNQTWSPAANNGGADCFVGRSSPPQATDGLLGMSAQNQACSVAAAWCRTSKTETRRMKLGVSAGKQT